MSDAEKRIIQIALEQYAMGNVFMLPLGLQAAVVDLLVEKNGGDLLPTSVLKLAAEVYGELQEKRTHARENHAPRPATTDLAPADLRVLEGTEGAYRAHGRPA